MRHNQNFILCFAMVIAVLFAAGCTEKEASQAAMPLEETSGESTPLDRTDESPTEPIIKQEPAAETPSVPAEAAEEEQEIPSPPPASASAPAPEPEPSEPEGTLIAEVSQVPPGESFDFSYEGTKAILVNFGGRFVAYINECTHARCPTELEGDVLNCPCHGSKFEASDGSVIKGPANTPLAAIDVFVYGGSVYAR